MNTEELEMLQNEYLIGLIEDIYTRNAQSAGEHSDGSEIIEQMNDMVLAMLANLKNEEIVFDKVDEPTGIRVGKVIDVSSRLVHIQEGDRKRSFNINTLHVYHDAIYAALSVI